MTKIKKNQREGKKKIEKSVKKSEGKTRKSRKSTQKATSKVLKVKKKTISRASESKHDDRKKATLDKLRGAQRRTQFYRRRTRKKKEEDEFDVRLVSIRRVSKVHSGGKRLRISVMVVIGDKKGKVGIGLAKGKDVRDAQSKAVNKAKKNMTNILLRGQTIPHEIFYKFGAAKVILKPASPGTGVIAGSAVRSVVEVAGIKDILSKVLGTKNIIPNVYATFEALKELRLKRFNTE